MEDIVISFTPGQAWACLLALAAAVAALDKAWSVLMDWGRKRKSPDTERDQKIKRLEEKTEAIAEKTQKIDGLERESEDQREALCAILHDRIYSLCMFYIKQRWIDMDGLRNLEYLYRAYHREGGNGTGTELFNRAASLPIKDGNEKQNKYEEEG